MALVVADRGEPDAVLAGGTDGKNLQAGIVLLEQIGGFIEILPPEPRGIEQARLSLDDRKPDRSGRPAGDHDPVITCPLEFRSERAAAGRLAPDSRQGGFRADRKPGGPREPACDHRAGHHHERALRSQGIGVQGIPVQEKLRAQRASSDEFPVQLIVDDEIRTTRFRQVDTQVPPGIPFRHGSPQRETESISGNENRKPCRTSRKPAISAGIRKDGATHRKSRHNGTQG